MLSMAAAPIFGSEQRTGIGGETYDFGVDKQKLPTAA
jgi:hypothetical protein